ncbi:hypothetical protein [Streptomyces sp. SID14515]|uniref:hypothetical protein n=1 Tax=Streptomyces sp. SID14515 TaxID=2706074 RepID=UPI0013C71A0B|nr:hypothetical protein [Streptomyces sp. SID14515]NEB42263.1 hypothetical protein [Streptomyces sp. SID14515]
MPRTALTPTNLGVTDVADPTGTAIDSTLVTNGVVINAADPSRIVLRVANSAGSAKKVTVRAGGKDGPAWMRTQGDTEVSVGASGTRWVGPFSEARYLQHGGKLNIDFESGFTGTITAFKLSRSL